MYVHILETILAIHLSKIEGIAAAFWPGRMTTFHINGTDNLLQKYVI
jgi:hypothetical protein